MKNRTTKAGFNENARRQAIEFARKDRSGTSGKLEKPSVQNENWNHSIKAAPFNELEGYKKLHMIRAAGDLMRIRNPFFRSHEGRASATTTIEGSELVNFGSYDYLGLNSDPRTAAAANRAIDIYGTSASASRIVAGERPVHQELETELANHYQTDDAITFVSGHATNVATISEIVGEGDLILHDALIHNSVLVGAQLSGASRLSFSHNDLTALEQLLETNRKNFSNALVVVEGLYSMDGDLAPLTGLIKLREKYGFWLMVDEAHALGCVGKTGKGSFEHFGVDPSNIDIWMGTLSKTLASTGGYIAGSNALIELLKSQASGFVYSVGLSPPLAAAASSSIRILHAEPERVTRLKQNCKLFLEYATELGLDCGTCEGFSVVPVMIGDSLLAAKLCERLHDRQFNVMPILFPAVPMKSARLRFFITSEHTRQQLTNAAKATHEELDRLRQENFGADLPAELFEL